MSLLRRIAFHATRIILPEAICLGFLAGATYIPESYYIDEHIGKRTLQIVFGGIAVGYALYLIYYYIKLIEKKCRAPRQVEFIEMQPVRMRHHYRQFPRYAPPGEVLPTNGFEIREERPGDAEVA